MIPYPYNFVDMGGIDLAEANGTVVPGLYSKIVEGVNDCGDVVLYNWKFADIEIAPQHTQIFLGTDSLLINSIIQVTELDVVTVLGIAPPPVPVSPLQVTENGVYRATSPASGFNPVTVDVQSEPVIITPLLASANGVYNPTPPASGFSPVTVDVESAPVYTNTPAGYDPYYVEVSAGDTLVTVGSTEFKKYNSTPAYGAFVKSMSNYGAIILTLPAASSVQDDLKFSPNYVEYGTTTVDGVPWRWSMTSGLSADYVSGPLTFDSTTGGSWTTIRNDLIAKISRYTPPEFPVYAVSSRGLITVPTGYSGFGPLYIT